MDEMPIIDERVMLCASLIGEYCFDKVKDVIRESAIHQRDLCMKWHKERVGEIFGEVERMRGDSNLMTPWGNSFDITWEEWQELKQKYQEGG